MVGGRERLARPLMKIDMYIIWVHYFSAWAIALAFIEQSSRNIALTAS